MCVVRNSRPVCECPTCSEEFKPVCGSDGISYTNECKLKSEACEKRKTISVRYQGLCNGCENKKCDHYAICESDGKGGAQCVCPSSCVQVDDKVCATDGITYLNECEMRVASCRKQQFIMIASQGPCDLCANVKCRFGARCENGKCVCPQNCPYTSEPVCANDGLTYNNECEMQRQACMQAMELEVIHSGECDEISGSGEEGSAVEVCDETTCKYGGTCEYDLEGTHGCSCNFNCEAIRAPVCGSDGKTYGNECQMREQACQKQMEIFIQPMENCEDMDEELCDGNSPLINPQTGREYNCQSGRETCPAGSYCHKVAGMAQCCKEEQQVRSCSESRYGCCPDGKTSAPGPNDAGCPSVCQCHPLGAFNPTCDPRTLQCSCKPGVGGRRCDRCDPGYWGLPRIAEGNAGCTPCGCSLFGSVRDDCEQMTGRCVCKPGVAGQKCSLCPSGREIGPGGCNDNSTPVTSCSQLVCRFGSKCQVTNNMAECVCTSDCPPSHEPLVTVCGTDGQTYGSDCQLRFFACRLQKDIRVAHQGPCQGSTSASTTTASPYGRPRKTTRHVSGKVTRYIVPPTPASPDYGFIGDFCDTNSDCVVEHSYCKSSPSLCQCLDGYTPSEDNLFCLDASFMVPSFMGKSYLELPKLHHANRELSIELEFRALNNDGILLYSGQDSTGKGDFVALTVKDGRVQFRYDLGSGQAVLETQTKVVLNRFHKVVARRFGQDGLVKLDNNIEATGRSTGSLKSLNLGTSLYLGYVSDATNEVFKNIGVELGLVGCIESLKIESKDYSMEYDLMYPGSKDIITGAGIGECGTNPCSSLPCQNGGSCMKLEREDYECQCAMGWAGRSCEIDLSSQPCDPNPCQGGGTCSVHPKAGFICRCPPGKDGFMCEKSVAMDITVPEFRANAFLELKSMTNVGRTLSMEIWFLAKDPNGVILYAQQEDQDEAREPGDFISLNLVDGYLQFMFDLGSGFANVTSPEPMMLNVWNRVDVARTNRQGTMIINAETPLRAHSKGNLKELNLGETFFLGGYPGEFNPNSGITTGFKGAIQRVFEDGQLMENMVPNAVSVYNLRQYDGPPCPTEDPPCQNGGECIPVLNDYECKCPPDFTGKDCDRVAGTVDIEMPVAFDGRTYHKYPNKITTKEKSQMNNKFELKFRTDANDGLLLLLHKGSTIQGDYLAIAVRQGHVEVSYNLGKQGPEDLHVIRDNKRVSDGRWHSIVFTREKRKGTLTVDGEASRSDVSEQGATQLDTDGNLWIGGTRHLPMGLPDAYDQGFRGCIQYVLIEDKDLQLVEKRLNHQPVEFCNV